MQSRERLNRALEIGAGAVRPRRLPGNGCQGCISQFSNCAAIGCSTCSSAGSMLCRVVQASDLGAAKKLLVEQGTARKGVEDTLAQTQRELE